MSLTAHLFGSTADENTPKVTLSEMREAPTIDGIISEDEWQDASRNIGFVGHSTRVITPRKAIFWIGRDKDNLYIAVKSELPPDGSLLVRAKSHPKRDIKAAFHDDSLEIVLDPKRERSIGDRKYYHMIFNAKGALYDRSLDPDNKQNTVDFSWRIPEWTMKNRVKDGWWHVEIAIPFTSMDIAESDLKTPWGIRICRNWKRPYQQSQWESRTSSYADQPTMPEVMWDENAPVVQVRSLHDNWKKPVIRVNIRNPHQKKIDIFAYIEDAWHNDQHQVKKESFTLAPGEDKTVELESVDRGPSGVHHSIITITGVDKEKPYYHRKFDWSMHRPESVWTVGKEQKKQVKLKFKYYPYYNKVRIYVNVSALSSKQNITGATVVIRNSANKKDSIWETELKLKKYKTDSIYKIPDLADGKYEIAVILKGKKGIPDGSIIRSFVRKRFEWERNNLGISDKVIPPFTPLQTYGKKVRCVLREHEHNNLGLWSSVVSKDKQILAGPMRWELQASGKVQGISRSKWKIIDASDTEVAGAGVWKAGDFKAEIENKYDYDGMMVCTLKFGPVQENIDRLSLVIPLKDSIARYMHAVGDGLRHNYAGFIPRGKGKIWDSSKANKINIISTFYPYIWLGDGERGLCWFADTDRDWILDEQTPVIDLTRKDGILYLRVHFITKPGKIERNHKIVFGLQVTPTKPMPEGWRRWILSKKFPGARPVRLIGHSMYWGAHYYLPYPLNKDFSYFEQMAKGRKTGKVDPGFIDNWMKKVAEIIPKDSAYYEKIERHVNAGMHIAKTCKWGEWRVFGYTNARGISFHTLEFPTFQDEWLNYNFSDRNWDRTKQVAYDVTPSKSMQDCLLWYYRKLLMCFEGVYWDNTYLSAHYDPVVGNAWTDDKGEVHPGMGLFQMRNLIKRTAVLWSEEEKNLAKERTPLITMPHMTNTMIVPILSFTNCTYDWEWRYGYEDFQDRFSPDLTVTETIGRQVGAWPTILSGGHPKPDDPRTPWMRRTRLGVCLVHELQPSDYKPKEDAELYQKLFGFGYGTDKCTVYNYWQEGHPAGVKGEKVNGKTLVISKQGAAIVVVTDYGEGGTCELGVDLEKLGLSMDASASDFETGFPIESPEPGKFAFPLKKHDFKILLIE